MYAACVAVGRAPVRTCGLAYLACSNRLLVLSHKGTGRMEYSLGPKVLVIYKQEPWPQFRQPGHLLARTFMRENAAPRRELHRG